MISSLERAFGLGLRSSICCGCSMTSLDLCSLVGPYLRRLRHEH